MTQEALKLALPLLEDCVNSYRLKYERPAFDKAIAAIKEALAQEQEPVAWHEIVLNQKQFLDKMEWLLAKTAAPPRPEQDSTCSITLRLQGKPYPRTCKKCGLGPCIAQPTAQPEQEPVADALHFAQWTAAKKDLSDYICIGELTLAGIEDNLEGLEFGESEIERFEAVIESLQENLVTGRECKKVPLIAYIGENNKNILKKVTTHD